MSFDVDRLYREIGNRCKEKRTEKGISQSMLAEKVGVLRTSISNIEKGNQRLPIYLLYQICEELGVDVASILPNIDNIRKQNRSSEDLARQVINEIIAENADRKNSKSEQARRKRRTPSKEVWS